MKTWGERSAKVKEMSEIDRNFTALYHGLKDLLQDHSRLVAPELPKFEKQAADKNVDLHDAGYFIWCEILDMDSVDRGRILDTVSYFVKSKNFKYDATNDPDNFVFVLAHTTYWLRDNLYEPDAYKYEIKDPEIQKDSNNLNIAKYFDIGVTLIKKGFNFKLSLDGIDNAAIPYARYYLKQCLRRHAYLERKKK